MFYSNTKIGTFLSRPNRFLAHVMVDGQEVVCHVKNTGRLRELLVPGVSVVVQHHPDAAAIGRKTEYSLIAVAKPLAGRDSKEDPISEPTAVCPASGASRVIDDGFSWVNIDSQAPNQVAFEWLSTSALRPRDIRREVRYGASRFDLAFVNEADGGTPWLMEVKGVTLDMNGTAMFPDAPTERGVKHLGELADAVENGFGAAVLFVIQTKGISAFAPHAERHPEFAKALADAARRGVQIWAYDCIVTEDSLQIDKPVPVVL